MTPDNCHTSGRSGDRVGHVTFAAARSEAGAFVTHRRRATVLNVERIAGNIMLFCRKLVICDGIKTGICVSRMTRL